MTSFVKETFFLAVYLICFIRLDAALATSLLRQPRATGHTLVPGISVAQNTPIPQRLEIRTFMQFPTYKNIFFLGLQALQAAATNQPLSFYLISGIHGTNLSWDGDDGGNYPIDYGYCRHADKLFPTWHRPYISLYEKTLIDLATQIVQTFPEGEVKNAHLAALQRWRIPYWDWAMDASIPDIVGRIQNVDVTTMQNGILKNNTMHNPLFSYCINPSDSSTMAVGNSQKGLFTVQTVRNPTVQNKVYVTRPSMTNNKMINTGSSLKNNLYNAMTIASDYNSFSNMRDSYHSMESCHGAVHVTVGGDNGHMMYPSQAAFDPIFFLHHANVDRLFAIWQAIYPNSYLSNQTSDTPNQDTELHPFRRTENQYWTSRLARDTTIFGYTYPELVGSHREDVIAAVNRMYGPSSSKKKQKRDLSTNDNSIIGEESGNTAPATHNEYITYIKISNCALHGSFSVNVFLSPPTSNETDCAMDPNCIGSFHVFTGKNIPQSRKTLVRGTVSLTTALYKLFTTGKLTDMTAKTIKAYLKANLKWNITGAQNEGFDLEGLEMTVVTAEVQAPKDEYCLPVWGQFSTMYKVV